MSKMAPFEITSPDEISIYAEFITSLCVANIYIGFQHASNQYRVRKISVEQRSINVTLIETGSDRIEPASLTLSAALPHYVRLLPNTCSNLQPTPYGWLLRMNIDEISDSDIPEPNTKPTGPFLPECRVCQNTILHSNATISTFVPMSALGLPPGMSWDQMYLSYFCHDHGDHGSEGPNHEEVSAKQQATFAPRLTDVFVCDSNYVFNAEAMDSAKISEVDDGDIRCGRCRSVLGQRTAVSGTATLYVDAVTSGSAFDDGEKMLGTFVKNCSAGSRRLCLSLQNSEEKFLLWIMDQNLKTFHARLGTKKHRTAQHDVCKVLYRQGSSESAPGMQWTNDCTVKQVKVHESLLARLMAELMRSTASMPMAWRHANDFCVGYLSV